MKIKKVLQSRSISKLKLFLCNAFFLFKKALLIAVKGILIIIFLPEGIKTRVITVSFASVEEMKNSIIFNACSSFVKLKKLYVEFNEF